MSTEFEFDVFLSHNSEDKPLVELIAQRLKNEFGLNPFLDKWNLIPGETWPNELERALDQSATTAVFLGTGGKGPWHDQEMQRALVKAVKTHEEYRIIPVLLPGADDTQVSGFLGLRTWVDFRAGVDDEEAFNRLVGGIKGEAIDSGGFELPDEPAPYRGLSRFEKEQADLFFGRTQDIEDLVTKLGNERFVAVLGASGSGKSSLVRAGLLPRLEHDALPGSKAWRVIIFLPGSEPLRALANQLAHELPRVERKEAADRLVTQLGEGENGLRDTLTSWYADSPAPLLLVIDQFEELFTQCNSETRSAKTCREATKNLIAGMADLVQSGGGEFRVLITLRADFLDRCLEFPVLRELLQDRQLLLGDLGDEALREAIVLPAQKVGAFFEKGLVNLILRDVTGERGSLPLLQHALFELWKARRGPWLTQEAYEESGGVTGALKRFAQRIYEGLKPDEQTIARNIFVRITSLGEGVSDTRRRVPRGDLYPAGVEPATVDRVIERLSGKDARLIVAGDEGVEVTHESLLQEWDTLRGWLESNRDAQRLRQQITEAAQLWQTDGGNDDDLYKGARLELAEQWEKEHPNTLTDLEQAFLDAGRALRSAQLEKLEREQQEREEQRQKELAMARELADKEHQRAKEADARRREKEVSEQRLRKRAWGLGLAMMIAVVFLAGAVWFAKDAAVKTELAEAATRDAKAEKNKAEQNLKAASHNLGMVFNEKAVQAQENGSATLARLYSLYAVKNIDLRKTPGRFHSAFDRIINLPDLRPAFVTPAVNIHDEAVQAVAWSPDGKILASGSSDNTIRLWDPVSGKNLMRLAVAGRLGRVYSVAWSPDGKILASGLADNTIRLWDPVSGRELARLEGHTDWVHSIAWSPDGKTLASGSGDNTVRLWDPAGGRERSRLDGHSDWVGSVAWAPDGETLASGSRDNTIRLWDPVSGRELARLEGHTDWVHSIAWSPDGKTLASGSSDQTIRLWDRVSGRELARLEGHGKWVRSVAWSPDGKILASGSRDKALRLWDPVSGRELARLEGHTDWVHSIAWAPDGKTLASGSWDNTIRLWDPASGRELTQLPEGHSGPVVSIAWSPDGRVLASGSKDKTIRLWDPASGDTLVRLEGYSGWHDVIAWSPDGKTLAVGSVDNTIRLWDPVSGRDLARLDGHSNLVTSISWSPGGKTLISESWDKTIRLWDPNSGRELARLEGEVDSIVWSPAGKILALLLRDKSIRLWDPINGLEARLQGHSGPVTSIAWSPDGKTLASGSGDKTLRLWDPTSGRERVRLEGHTGSVTSVDWSPDGKTLASGSADNTIRLWDPASGQEVAKLEGHTGSVTSVAWSPDGKILASQSVDKIARLWDPVSGRNLARLEGYTGSVGINAWSPNGKTLVSSSRGKIRLWDSVSGQELARLEGHSGNINSVVWSPDGKTLAAGSSDNTIRLWDPASGRNLVRLVAAERLRAVHSVAWSPDGKTLATGSIDNIIRLWAPAGGREFARLEGHSDWVGSVAWSPDGKTLASGSNDNTIRLWDLASGRERARLKEHTDSVASVAWSPDGKTLASGSSDKTIRLWDPVSGRELARLQGHSGGIVSIAWSPDGKTLATGSRDNTIRLWDPVSGRELARLEGHTDQVTSVAWSPDGKTLASGSLDHTIRLWDPANGSELARLKVKGGHSERYFSVAWSPDGKTLASGAWSPTIRLWDPVSGRELARLEDDADTVFSVAWSPDGRTLAAGSRDDTLRLWDVELISRNAAALEQQDSLIINKMIQSYRYRLNGIDLEPEPPRSTNLLGVKPQPADWSPRHPLHWLPKAEQGDAQAMTAVGLIYDRGNDIERAQFWYQQAKAAGSETAARHPLDLQYWQVRKAKYEARKLDREIQKLDQEAVKLAREGEIEKAIEIFDQARTMTPSLSSGANTFNELCWFGSLNNQAAQVIGYCDQAVAANQKNAGFRDSRGLARALTGNLSGAAEDFHFWVESMKEEDQSTAIKRRRAWIPELEAGRNPIGEAELNALRNE